MEDLEYVMFGLNKKKVIEMEELKKKDNRMLNVIFIFIFYLFNITLYAQTPANGKGFDFIVIVDQSGSMSGKSGPPSDQQGVRNDMVKRTFQLLAKNGIMNNVTHRFGVISFGSFIRIDLPLSSIDRVSLEKLQQQLDANLSNTSLEYTHFLEAFRAAQRMFSMALPPADEGKRIIVLVTDGAPYIPGIEINSYKENLKKLIQNAFPYPDFQLHVIALNDPSSDYWSQYGLFWAELSHNNDHKLKGDKDEIFRKLNEVIGNIIGTSSRHVPPDQYNNVVIPPYLESVVFDIFRIDPLSDVKIYPADSPDKPLNLGMKNVSFLNIGNTIQTVSVKKPMPGIWQIRKTSDSARVDIYMQNFFPRGKLLQPAPATPMRQFEKLAVKYRVEDGEGNPIKEIEGYPLILELSLVKPDNSRLQMKMQKSSNPSEPGVFETVGDIGCDLPGTYKTEVVIATLDFKLKQVTLFRDLWSQFHVKGAKLIEARCISPKPLDNFPPYQSLLLFPRSMTFSFQVVDEKGDSINLHAFFKGSTADLLTVYEVKGDKEIPVPMKFKSRENGILVGEPQGLNSPGQYHVRFRPNNVAVPQYYSMRTTPSELFFTRDITWLHWAQILGLVAVLLATAFLLGKGFYLKMQYPLKGTLLIERMGDKIIAEYLLTGKGYSLTLKDAFPNETTIRELSLHSARNRSGGIIIKSIIVNNNKELLKNRTISDKGSVSLTGIPYVIRYRLK